MVILCLFLEEVHLEGGKGALRRRFCAPFATRNIEEVITVDDLYSRAHCDCIGDMIIVLFSKLLTIFELREKGFD